ncbi:hypothetical protein F5B22DRAFT_366747 [Xylaria bambusicola]|uniref:uncharacterized protein n=1 Tax=Xylaria bambusicola TaxID=326684 RepID=UPI002007232D|nr:uncharacterized protein F5B22DRAFT_366747 [Xylaria bambusicola]KAI0509223.1 hypothetical protein F5B22DRAFT_366747 [Xylaria bambusicola]
MRAPLLGLVGGGGDRLLGSHLGSCLGMSQAEGIPLARWLLPVRADVAPSHYIGANKTDGLWEGWGALFWTRPFTLPSPTPVAYCCMAHLHLHLHHLSLQPTDDLDQQDNHEHIWMELGAGIGGLEQASCFGYHCTIYPTTTTATTITTIYQRTLGIST